MISFINSLDFHARGSPPGSSRDSGGLPRSIEFHYIPRIAKDGAGIVQSSSYDNVRRSSTTNSDYVEFDSSSDSGDSAPAENFSAPGEDKTEKSPYETILSFRDGENGEVEYFVKKKERPYRECEWVSESEYLKYPNSTQILKRYKKKNPFPPPEPYYDPAFDEIDRVIACDEEAKPVKYLVKWCSLGYEFCTWETDVDETQVELFWKRNVPNENLQKKFHYPSPESYTKLEPQEYKNGRKLFDYQQDGLNWLIFSWYHRRNCILADEMGLGKTIQAVSFIDYLYTHQKIPGPFLIIAPLSTLPHWQRSFQDWTDLNAVVYSGTRKAREVIRQYEFFYPDGSGPKFDVLIIQYENIMNDNSSFSPFVYNTLIVDEAHRLKNAHSKLLQALANIHSEYRILLTGTPLQNTVEELQSLLEFLHPGQFLDITNSSTSNDIMNLKNRLKPHLLRRLKIDVDQTIARKEETIIECALTKTQKQFYKAVLEMNAEFLSKSANLQNISMELRKVCLHPFLIKGAEEKIVAERGGYKSNEDALDCLVRSSGKFILLNKLLPKLKEEGHRVLIFSQMTQLLDIMVDYLNGVGYKFLRIDGGVPGRERQRMIDQFNAEGSNIFIFLLCTRAGGLGINLNSADTVIIFDSDWNPQNDLQAQARCHRIGQHKVVKVYRLLMKGTYEEHMFEAASRKLGLGQAILDKQKNQEIDRLLRKGAYHMLNDIEEENFGEQDIDQILSRSRVVVYNEKAGSTFSKANFDVESDDDNVDINDPNFWDKILPNKPEVREEEPEADDGHMRTRKRTQQPIDDDLVDDDVSKEWKRTERERLQHLLFWFGWDRWDDAQRLCGLKRPVLQIKLAARAFLRYLLYNHNDPGMFSTARMLLEKAMSTDFDPNYMNNDDAEAVDFDFMKQSSMIDPEFVLLMQKKGGAWIKRIELLYYITMDIEKANHNFPDIIVPKCQGNIPSDSWTLNDDRCLIYGTWKCGFAKYDDMFADEEIPFTYKTMENADPPLSTNLTPRLKKLAVGIKKYYSSDSRSADDVPTEITRPKVHLWRKRDKSIVLQQMLHGGVQLKPNGDYDWEGFRQQCGFMDKTDEQVEKLIDEMMNAVGEEKGESSETKEVQDNDAVENKDSEQPKESTKAKSRSKSKSKSKEGNEKDDEKDGGNISVTAGRIKQRFQSLTKLRRIFLKHTEEELIEYFQYLPRWRNVPRGWTNQMEYIFFKEISKRGWGVCGEILKLPAFETAFEGDPPTFVTLDTRVMRRLDFIMKYIEENTLESLREREATKPKRKVPPPQPELTPVPDIQYNENGTPIMPIHLTSTSYIESLGHIVYDRSGFHTERYIYPAGFKSSRMYASTLDPSKKVRYNCEIIDTGEQAPLFRVSMADNPEIKYEGNSPTSPWNLILKRILELRAETDNNPKALSISGPEYYGLASPAATYLIQQMPDSKKCVNYIEKEFAPPAPKNSIPKPPQQRKPRNDEKNSSNHLMPQGQTAQLSQANPQLSMHSSIQGQSVSQLQQPQAMSMQFQQQSQQSQHPIMKQFQPPMQNVMQYIPKDNVPRQQQMQMNYMFQQYQNQTGQQFPIKQPHQHPPNE